jgi:hypothetical protein
MSFGIYLGGFVILIAGPAIPISFSCHAVDDRDGDCPRCYGDAAKRFKILGALALRGRGDERAVANDVHKSKRMGKKISTKLGFLSGNSKKST